MNPTKEAVIGTSDYHRTMQQAAKHALQRQGGYVPHHTPDTLTNYTGAYPTLDMKLQHLHHMVCGIQFDVESQQMIATNPRITYLLLLDTLLSVSADGFEKPLKHARMRLIALLVEICVTGQVNCAEIEGLAGYLTHLTSQTPAYPPFHFTGYRHGQKAQHFTEYCLSIAETLHAAMSEELSYRVGFLKFWKDLESNLIINRGWLDIEVSMNWLREQIILRLEPDKP